jgi:hypothetical protein
VLDIIFLVFELYKSGNPKDESKRTTIAMFLLVFTALISLCVGGLACYHGKLACSGMTTNEELRGKYGAGNPYDQGCNRNCEAFC